ncbi:hypothetical protein B0H10DRAFT_1773239 [Mycena sp. CBHHK59/15]|nr:hypothetical protein B0H10DRAFT_1773239 [Mycena sp. CBHHK59/15]
MKFKIVSGNLRSTHFSVKWTVNRSVCKDMQLMMERHYDDLIEEATQKAKPEVKLQIDETEADDASADRDGDDDEEAAGKSKKRKVCQSPGQISSVSCCDNRLQLSAEEEQMAETIVQLRSTHTCSDRSCTSQYCFLGNETGQHIRLTPIHFSTWAAAIVGYTQMK